MLIGRKGIAGAVMREIDRMERFGLPDGAAYKAEWDRRGSSALVQCFQAERDADLMHFLSEGGASARAAEPRVAGLAL
jgi:hypothetical protein